ncbi:DJ-1/PfpI family protein [Tissierella pigra]|uniref:DJ-1/PfpI family protein n=1 Tax=Tissierella pigra TaxID=2607614 RepID=A0A6N7Y309_9FIRM|nr:DJ-1/PfpI family protein [Tissierella pigra]MBU5427485.1 DJ-1/PfpI family protein [Tissierella pigra]MSU03175.1 DJ-1/PfpI family protein [Tissierella pigra]
MSKKKTAVLLYDDFSNYEFSVMLSIFLQADKPYTTFSLTKDPVRSEEGLKIVCDALVEDLNIEEFDSLVLTGCMDLEPIINEERIYSFLKQFDLPRIKIASISSTPFLLARAGLLKNKRYLAGMLKEELLKHGHTTIEELEGMVDIAEYRESYEEIGHFIKDGNILTSVGAFFREWAIEFGKMLELDFESGWYGDFKKD